ncbi:Ras- protein RABE1d [Bulinus truncatus]|nr:Ras- protein RABE1d [Bulinus truncatus]
MAIDYAHLVKIFVVGDADVGKKDIILEFYDTYKKPPHIDYFNYRYNHRISDVHMMTTREMDGETIKFDIGWSAPGGTERLKLIYPSDLRGTQGIMLVYDVNESSKVLPILSAWLKNIQKNAKDELGMMLIGYDHQEYPHKPRAREVSVEQGQQFANDHGLRFMEVSSKNNLDIEEAFCSLARDCISILKNYLIHFVTNN